LKNTKKELKVATTPKKGTGIPENFALPNEADELVKFTNDTGTFFLVFNRATNKFGVIDKIIDPSLAPIANNLATKEQWPMISKAVKDETGKIVVTSNKTTDKFSIEFIKQTKEGEIKETPKEESKKYS
jgi:hypothetical protein